MTVEPRPTAAHPPCLKAIMTRLAASLWIACIVPALLFSLTLLAFNITAAVVVALAWSYAAIAWRRLTRRPVSGLLCITVTVLTIRSIFALATGDSFIYFFQPIVSDGVLASLFLLSLATARPVVARLAADFYPMDVDIAARPRIQRLFWRLTLMWAFVCLLRGAIGFWLLQSQSLVDFVMIKNVCVVSMTLLAVVATVWASVQVARKEGLLAVA